MVVPSQVDLESKPEPKPLALSSRSLWYSPKHEAPHDLKEERITQEDDALIQILKEIELLQAKVKSFVVSHRGNIPCKDYNSNTHNNVITTQN
jgi:hypothetical protein